MSEKRTTKIIGAGILTAIASSLCCISPLLALLAGGSGVATTFSWVEPARPYLIGFTVLVLVFAWGQKLKPKKVMACNCEEDSKPSFLQSKIFLTIVTFFAIVMTALPYYSSVFYPNAKPKKMDVNTIDVQKITVGIEGMSCEACQNHINNAITELPGILEINTSYVNGNAIIEFDKTKTSTKEIKQAINSIGYTAITTE